jgi:hypothetical protein
MAKNLILSGGGKRTAHSPPAANTPETMDRGLANLRMSEKGSVLMFVLLRMKCGLASINSTGVGG